MKYVFVVLGGGAGSALRYWMQGLVHDKFGSGFPYGTLTVNVIGSFLIGFLMISMEERFLSNPSLRLLLTIGLLGGFTTFSSFSYETMALARDGELLRAFANIGFTVFTCLLATWAGMRIGKWV